jgi:hypothetical protein
MESLYHAYQSYERQVIRGVFCTRRPRTATGLSFTFECLMANLGDMLIRVGHRLKRRCEIRQTVGSSPVLGKLDR